MTQKEREAFEAMREALHLTDAAYRLAERSTPANLRRAVVDARAALALAESVNKQ